MRELVTDTHGFLWHLYAASKLGTKAKEAFADADAGKLRIFIPALVVAEALMVSEKRRIDGLDTEGLLPQLRAARFSDNYVLSDLRASTVLASHQLTAIPDIFDRLIVAEALERGLALLSRDSVIRESGLVQTIWD
jgi:PIN domain nuclease of toxin-antitoxin system